MSCKLIVHIYTLSVGTFALYNTETDGPDRPLNFEEKVKKNHLLRTGTGKLKKKGNIKKLLLSLKPMTLYLNLRILY